jgi:hypothetical protein
MTSLCVPVTDIFRRNQDELLPLVNAVSFKDPTDEVFPGKEHMLECSLNVADPAFERELADAGLLAALQTGRFTSFACDVGPAWAVVGHGKSPNGYPRYLAGTGPMTATDYLEQAQKNVAFLRKQFTGKIKVENLNYFPSGGHEIVCEAEFIARIVRDTGIELLLDIGHLTISMENLETTHEEYLDQLPLETVSEVQISGSNIMNGIWEDTHEVPNQRDFDLLDHLCQRTSAQYVTLEYYKDDQKLVDAYQKMAKLELLTTP